MKGSFRSALVTGLIGVILGLALRASTAPPAEAAAPPTPREKLPAYLQRTTPVSASELRLMQEHVKKVLKKVIPATVGIRMGPSAGSGVIIDAEGHVLTAGHVSGEPNRPCQVILPDGRVLKAKTLGRNSFVDSGLIKIVDKPEKGKGWNFAEMGDSSKLKLGQWCLSIGQPGGFRPGRSPVVRLGRIQQSNPFSVRGQPPLVQSDCTLVGGDSGGPLFDMDGRVIGIHSRIGPQITANIHVPVNTYRDTWARLIKGESFTSLHRPNAGYIGVVFTYERDDLVISEVTEDTPAAKAGLKKGDVVVAVDGTKVGNRGELAAYMEPKSVGDEIALEVLRDKKPMTFKLKLCQRPAD
jgi:serine protease Do